MMQGKFSWVRRARSMESGKMGITGAISHLRLLSFRRDRSGTASIEFAILALPFFVLVFALLEICLSFTVRQMLSYSTETVARQLQTGQLLGTDLTAEELRRKLCGNIQIVVAHDCPGLTFSLNSFDTFKAVPVRDLVDGSGKLLNANLLKPGGSSSINQLNVLYRWPIITDLLKRIGEKAAPDGKLNLFSTITWQNEPFPEGEP